MADAKLSALTPTITDPVDADVIYIVTDVATTPSSEGVTMGDFLGNTGDVIPRADITSNLGSEALRYDMAYFRSLRSWHDPNSLTTLASFDNSHLMGLTIIGTVGSNDAKVGGSAALPAALINCASNLSNAADTANFYANSKGATLLGCLADCLASSGGSIDLEATGVGSLVFGSGFNVVSTGPVLMRASGQGAKIFANCTVTPGATAASVTAQGNYSNIFGVANASAGATALLNTVTGSNACMVMGLAANGTIQASTTAAFAGGNMSGTGRTYANGVGAFAYLDNRGSGNSDVTGEGSQIWGKTTTATPIACSANNATQWGPGTNRNVNTGQWGVEGTGIAVKGTSGAFANVANGQIYNNAGTVTVRSAGVNIVLAQSAAYTLTATQAPSRTLNNPGAASIANNNAVLSALITDLKATGLIL